MATEWIALTGQAQAGKSTAAAYLRDFYGFTVLGFADDLRAMAWDINPLVAVEKVMTSANQWEAYSLYYRDAVERLGYETAKVRYPEVRRFLQRLGTEGIRNNVGANYWVESAVERAQVVGGNIVFEDARFPNEVAAVHEAGGTVLRILRPGAGLQANGEHPSEANEGALHTDWAVENDGSLDVFKARLDFVLATIPVTPTWIDALNPMETA